MDKGSKIYVAGHTGLVGSAVVRKLRAEGYENILTSSSKELDLRDQYRVSRLLWENKPDYVIICAGTVGGILANNTRKAEFIYNNLMIQANIIHAAYLTPVKKLLAIGSSCIYPKDSPQPIKEEYLLTGLLEPTNEPYAIAKIAALKMCDAYRDQYGCSFISAMPTNMYGPGDNYDLNNSHVLPALIRKFIVAKRDNTDVVIWGTGKPLREFLYVDDMADACLFLMNNYNEPGHINIGTGVEIELNDVVKMIAEAVGFTGRIVHDLDKPDGMYRKRLDVPKINSLGWKAKTTLVEGIKLTIEDIITNNKHLNW